MMNELLKKIRFSNLALNALSTAQDVEVRLFSKKLVIHIDKSSLCLFTPHLLERICDMFSVYFEMDFIRANLNIR